MTRKQDERLLISVSEACELAGLSRSVGYRLLRENALPGAVKLPGAQVMVRRRVLEAWLNGERHSGA